MIHVKVDAETRDKLSQLDEPAQLCDENGQVLGEFRPAVNRSNCVGVDSPLSTEELQLREQETETYTTREVLERLKDL